MADDTPDIPQLLLPQDYSTAEAMLRAIQGQQQQQAQQRSGLAALLGQQQQQAAGLRGLGLVASLGANPLLQGLRQTAEQQGMGLENAAARTEARLSAAKASTLDPLRLIALQQAAERLKQQGAEAAAREAAQNAALEVGKRKVALAEQKAAQGPKTPKQPNLPPSEVTSLADMSVAIKTLDDLEAAHKQVSGLSNSLLGKLPNTAESQYNAKKNAAIQVVGTILEHGKMTDGDIPKYDKIFPQVIDNPESGHAKVATLKKMLKDQAEQRKKTFGEAGYNVQGVQVPTIDLNAPTPAAPTAPAMPPAPHGAVGPGDPRNVKSTYTVGRVTYRVYADGHVEKED